MLWPGMAIPCCLHELLVRTAATAAVCEPMVLVLILPDVRTRRVGVKAQSSKRVLWVSCGFPSAECSSLCKKQNYNDEQVVLSC